MEATSPEIQKSGSDDPELPTAEGVVWMAKFQGSDFPQPDFDSMEARLTELQNQLVIRDVTLPEHLPAGRIHVGMADSSNTFNQLKDTYDRYITVGHSKDNPFDANDHPNFLFMKMVEKKDKKKTVNKKRPAPENDTHGGQTQEAREADKDRKVVRTDD